MVYGQPSIGGQRRGGIIAPSIPPKTMPSDKDSSVTLCQIIAMSMCYRRLGFIFLIMPGACMFAPVFLNVFLGVLNATTQNLGLPCLVLVFFTTRVWCYHRDLYAPSLENKMEAQRQDQVILPVGIFLCFCLLLWFFEIPEETWALKELRWTPNVAWDVGIRPAIGLALINVAILFRFVGPGSFVRCSTVPLASNHYMNSMRNCHHFMVGFAVPIKPFMMNPQGIGNFVSNSSIPQKRNCGRRYQLPTVASGGANMLVTCLVGFLVAEYTLLPYYQGMAEARRLGPWIDFTSLMTMTLHLWISGAGHELNPKQFRSHMSGEQYQPTLLSRRAMVQIAKRVVCVMFATVSIGVACIGTTHKSQTLSMLGNKNTWPFLLRCMAISGMLGGYASTIEEAAKSSLFVVSCFQRFVREVITSGNKTGGEAVVTMQEEFVIDAALHCLLHGYMALVQQIGESTASKANGNLQLETTEAHRNREAITVMANVMLGRQDSEVSLEEDVLRISLLESLGGSSASEESSTGDNSISKEVGVYPMDARHVSAIEYWVMPSTPRGHTVAPTNLHKEQKSILLTRGLSALAGGLGQALSECSESNSTTWLLRPGLLCAAEYCVIALSRVFLVSFEYNKKTGSDFRRTQLSSLIPATLNSMYYLHAGLLKHAQYLEHLRGSVPPPSIGSRVLDVPEVNEQLSKHHPDLHFVLHAIEEAGKGILRQTDSAMPAVQQALDRDSAQWLKRIAVSSQNS